MKYYRYMSTKEFSLLCAGCDIKGKSSFKARTNSMGVCFLAEKTEAVTEDNRLEHYTPETAFRFLSGIVSEDVLVEFETETELSESWGIYADPQSPYFDGTMTVTEYNIPFYNRDIMHPVRYTIPTYRNKWVWYNLNLV